MTIKVWPTSEEKRKILRHPTAGAFRPQGHAEWPDDTFTFRRIRDGDITTTAPKTEQRKTAEAKPRATE